MFNTSSCNKEYVLYYLLLSTFLLKIWRNENIKFNWFECQDRNIFPFFTSLISFFFDVQFQFSACFFKLFFNSMTLFEPSFNVIDNLISTKRWAFQPFLFYLQLQEPNIMYFIPYLNFSIYFFVSKKWNSWRCQEVLSYIFHLKIEYKILICISLILNISILCIFYIA